MTEGWAMKSGLFTSAFLEIEAEWEDHNLPQGRGEQSTRLSTIEMIPSLPVLESLNNSETGSYCVQVMSIEMKI